MRLPQMTSSGSGEVTVVFLRKEWRCSYFILTSKGSDESLVTQGM